MQAPSFLIVKMSSLGDILLSLNVARYLKKREPAASVHWVVEERFQELVRSSPYVDVVHVLDTKQLKISPLKFFSSLNRLRKSLNAHYYDAIFDLQGNCKSALTTFLAQGTVKVGWGRKNVSEWPNLLFTHRHMQVDLGLPKQVQYLEFVKRYFKESSYHDESPHLFKPPEQTTQFFKEGLNIMVCPGSRWWSKQLSEETWKALLDHIDRKYHPTWVLIWGSQADKHLVHRLKHEVLPGAYVFGELSFSSWQQLMLQMQCVISVDSSALHLAAITGVPTLSIYGPSSPKVYKPQGEKHRAYQGSCPYHQTFESRCPLLRTCSSAACIKKLPIEPLVQEFDQLMTLCLKTTL